MKEVTKFQSNDGKIFDTEEEAIKQDKYIELQQWYYDNELLGNVCGSRVELDDLIEWLKEHKERILEVL